MAGFEADAGGVTQSGILALREEILISILSFLDPSALLASRSCCKKLRNLVDSNSLWANQIANVFNPPGTTWKSQIKRRPAAASENPAEDGRLLRKFKAMASAGVMPGGRFSASAATTVLASSSRRTTVRNGDASSWVTGSTLRCFVACFHSDSSALFQGEVMPASAADVLQTRPMLTCNVSGPRAELVVAGLDSAAAAAAGIPAGAAVSGVAGERRRHHHLHHHDAAASSTDSGCESCRLRDDVFTRPGVLELHKQIAASSAAAGAAVAASASTAAYGGAGSASSAPDSAAGATRTTGPLAVAAPFRARFLQLKLVLQHGGFLGPAGPTASLREAPLAVLASDISLQLRDGSCVPAHAVLTHASESPASGSSASTSSASASSASAAVVDAGTSAGPRSVLAASASVLPLVAALNGEEAPAATAEGEAVVGAALWPAGFTVLRLAFPFGCSAAAAGPRTASGASTSASGTAVRFEPEALERCAGLCIPLRSVTCDTASADATSSPRHVVGPVVSTVHFGFVDSDASAAPAARAATAARDTPAISCPACTSRGLADGAIGPSLEFVDKRFGNAEPAVAASDWEGRIWQIYRPIPGGAFGKIEGDVAGGAFSSGNGGAYASFKF